MASSGLGRREGIDWTGPETVENVFRDFNGRRAGMIKAFTTEVLEFRRQCDPEKDNLCLYGFPDEHWEVNLPAEEVPPELPEPLLGINFARDGMRDIDWLSLVAVHSDAWLLNVAFYIGGRFGFDKDERKRLFNMINEMPTLFEVVSGRAKKQTKNSSVSNHSSNTKINSKGRPSESDKNAKAVPVEDQEEEEEEEDEENGDTLCGACGEKYVKYEFWIGCDICDKWFHATREQGLDIFKTSRVGYPQAVLILWIQLRPANRLNFIGFLVILSCKKMVISCVAKFL